MQKRVRPPATAVPVVGDTAFPGVSERDLLTVRRLIRRFGLRKFIEYAKQIETEARPPGAPTQSQIRQALFVALYRRRRWRSKSACARDLNATFDIQFVRTSNPTTYRKSKLGGIKHDLLRGLSALKNQSAMQELVGKVSEGFPFLARMLRSSGKGAAVSFLGTTVILVVKNPKNLGSWLAVL
jgi:hypothetical protein